MEAVAHTKDSKNDPLKFRIPGKTEVNFNNNFVDNPKYIHSDFLNLLTVIYAGMFRNTCLYSLQI